MASCIDNIIGVRGVCGQADTESLSGYFISDYPGITIKSASQINDEKTITGYNYLLDIRRRAMMKLNNDVQSYINANYRVNSIPSSVWSSGEFKTNYLATSPNARGIVAYKQKPQCRFYTMVIQSIRILANYTGATTLTISDTGGMVYTINVTLTAGVIKELIINKEIIGNEVQITLPGNIPVYSTGVNCGIGCGGTMRNECVRINGLANGNLNTSEGYGILANILCKCDLSRITCDLATQSLLGQAAYELCGAMFYEEAISNNRISYMTIYQSDQLKAESDKAYARYEQYLTNMFAGLRNYLVQNDGNCKCVDCSGIVIKTSV